jgi:hypothetical protein
MPSRKEERATGEWLPLRPPRPTVDPRQEAARRVRPVLGLVGVDLAKLPAAVWREAELQLVFYAKSGAQVSVWPDSRGRWQGALMRVGKTLAALVHGTSQKFELVKVPVRVEPSTTRGHREWRKTFDLGLTDFGTALTLAIIDDVITVSVERLKACPYRAGADQPECGRIFLAQKRQTWCSPEHRVQAAYRAWTRRGRLRHTGSSGAKGEG